jgi:hypothetical protein
MEQLMTSLLRQQSICLSSRITHRHNVGRDNQDDAERSPPFQTVTTGTLGEFIVAMKDLIEQTSAGKDK